MNNKIITVILIVFFIAGLESCVKEKFAAPTISAPTVAFSSNMTIAGLNTFYADSLGAGFGEITQDYIIKGVVVGNDESGNIYKNLYIEDNTGGIDIAIDESNIYTTFRLGQQVYIKCQGLYLGNYSGVPELGYTNNGAIGRIPIAFIKDHFFLDSFPQNPPVPTTLSMAQLASSAYYSTLIRMNNVHFQGDIGQAFCIPPATASNHNLYDQSGSSSVVIRTSSYANFASKKVPSGTGSVIGILSSFNGISQITLRDSTDLIGFN